MLVASGFLNFLVFLPQAMVVLGSWHYPIWLVLVNLAPSVLAMMTLFVAFYNKLSVKLS